MLPLRMRASQIWQSCQGAVPHLGQAGARREIDAPHELHGMSLPPGLRDLPPAAPLAGGAAGRPDAGLALALRPGSAGGSSDRAATTRAALGAPSKKPSGNS